MTERTFREEGSAGGKFVKLMRTIGHNTDTEVRLGTVQSAPPNLRIKVDGRENVLDPDDCVVAEHLTEHTRTITLSGGSVSGSTTTNLDHTHGLSSFGITVATMTVEGSLRPGDRVILLAYETTMGTQFVVVDKAVSYGD